MAFQFPDPFVTPEFTGANGVTYQWDTADEKWVIKGFQVDFDDRYVNKTGSDTMQGPLSVTGGRNLNADGIASTVETLNVDSGQNSSLHLKFDGATQVYVGEQQTSFQGDIKFNVPGRSLYAGTIKKGFTLNDQGVFYEGNYTADKHIATKKNVEEAVFHDITDPDSNKFVKVDGDTMTGNLVMDDSRLDFENRRGGQVMIRANREPGEFPVVMDLPHNSTGGTVSGGYDIKLQGNTAYNALRFVGGDTYMEILAGGGAPQKVKFYTDVSLEYNKISKVANATNDDDAVPYGQVKSELQAFRNEVISDLTFGTWQYASGSTSPVLGRCYFRNASNQNSGISASQVTRMVFNEVDLTGAVGGFDRIDVGEIISLTNGSITIKYKINSTAAISGSQSEVRSFDVVFISQTSPIVFVDGINWTFTLTEFTDISVDQLDDTYLRLDCANDPLASELEIKTPDFGEASLILNGKRDNTNNSAATIKFLNQIDTGESYAGYLTYRSTGTQHGYFRFNQNVDLNQKALINLSSINLNNVGVIKANDNQKIVIRNAGNNNEGNANVVIERPPNSRRGFAIRGNNSSNVETDLFWSLTNSSGGDAINYTGNIVSSTNIVNKQYVDNAVSGAGSSLPTGGTSGQVLKKSRSNNEPAWQGVVDISTSGQSRTIGEMWYNQNDGTLYLRVS